MASAAEFLEKVVERINAQPQRLGVDSASFQFTLTGDGGGTWTMVIQDGRASVQQGAVSSPQVTVEMSVADFQEMLAGRLGPVAAYMSGRLRLVGDIGLAMRLQPYLS
ncbi:SCP2 sterol-binding domain-containing protein [Geochorda subterranea]|uniref:SCP2 sterol-binding domain-containing protein n=1 Tax=Geochorda subterranea TaxID=3109564 RepID=A0ABZ1BNA5_9FIRM|nr:SCP2 sterol-binding domain-containing protein [Limnochorda sp. LNt]WRP14319.1 SCP2 sterol-binding domain-containing protein [Limnochorda sp. LNt]